jgi:hypothetical protein
LFFFFAEGEEEQKKNNTEVAEVAETGRGKKGGSKGRA